MNNALEKQLKLRWRYLLVGIVMMLFLGLIYAWSVLRVPLEAEFGWTSTQSSLTFSISMTMFCVGGMISGITTSKYGARLTITIAAILFAAGFGFASAIQTLIGIYITYGVLCGLGCGMGYNSVIGTIIKWFPDKQGLASGFTLMGFGFGSMVLGTIVASLITDFGWRTTFVMLAISMAILFFIGSIILKAPPKEFAKELSSSGKTIKPSYEDVDYKIMLKRRNFWVFFCWAIAVSSAGLIIMNISAQYANTILGGDLTQAAAVAGIISITNGIGRVMFGRLYDLKGYKLSMLTDVILYIVAGALLLITNETQSAVMLIVAFIVSGFAYGGISPNISAFCMNFFGKANYSLNYSIIYLNLLVASFLGPMLGANSYSTSFMFMIAFGIVGFILTMLIKQNSNKAQ